MGPPAVPLEPLSPEGRGPVARPVVEMGWRDLTFVHWPFEPERVQRQLPAGLRVDTFDGAAWIGLVPFVMHRVRLPRSPSVPWLLTFPETNVRTYVVGPDGRRGVWFFSLDIPRSAGVPLARTAFGIPYCWSAMTVTHEGGRTTYRCRRRWPRSPAARSIVTVEPGEPLRPTEREHFLTARWALFGMRRGRLVRGDMEHPPWTLHAARILEFDDGLAAAAGFPAPGNGLLVHWTAGVDARGGRARATGP